MALYVITKREREKKRLKDWEKLGNANMKHHPIDKQVALFSRHQGGIKSIRNQSYLDSLSSSIPDHIMIVI
jgi:hypothetical protein